MINGVPSLLPAYWALPSFVLSAVPTSIESWEVLGLFCLFRFWSLSLISSSF